MSFATVLDGYCKSLGYTNQRIAEQCQVSASALSRYRMGKRSPQPDSAVVEKLANGIAELSTRGPGGIPMRPENVKAALEASLTGSEMAGMNFNTRLDKLMDLLSMHNSHLAATVGVDASYISRIRKGQRTPADRQEFAELCARIAAQMCFEQNAMSSLVALVNTADGVMERIDPDIDSESDLAELIEQWLLGDNIVNSDLAKMEGLLHWLDHVDLSEWMTMAQGHQDGIDACSARFARFYYGIDGMRDAELDFLSIAYQMRVNELFLSSDMPLLQMHVTDDFLAKYKKGVAELLQAGCHVNIIHIVERPLGETVRALRTWIPLYLTGSVTPYYLKGVHNRLFCHVNYVCDVCALAAEAVMGHQESGRYYLTTRPEDVRYYRRKMRHILENSSSLLEIYRGIDQEQEAAFKRMEKQRLDRGNWRVVGEKKYRNLRVVVHQGDCVSITLPCGQANAYFVIRHPKIRYAISQME